MNDSIVLFSGGLDSALCAEMEIRKGNRPRLVSFNYGQSNLIELEYAEQLATGMNLPHETHKLPRIHGKIGDVYPGRNLILISAAMPIACSNNTKRIIIGCNLTDYNEFPDCRIRFIDRLNGICEQAKYPFIIDAPLINLTKKEVVEKAIAYGVNLGKTWSCYQPKKIATETWSHWGECGKCGACMVRRNAIENNA